MRLIETALPGAHVVEPQPIEDARGFFARTFCAAEFAARGLATVFVQHNTSGNIRRGTLRGLHFQRPPHQEVKVVSCLKGAVFDVIVDLRPASPTFRRWLGVELSAANRRSLYIPEGFAHGFQTLADDSEVGYLMSAMYEPGAAAGYRWDDPAFAIAWPLPPAVMSEKDRAWPPFVVAAASSGAVPQPSS